MSFGFSKADNINNFELRNKWFHENSYVLEDSGLLIKRVSETIKNEAKEQKGGFLRMLLGTLGASLLGNMFASKGVMRADEDMIKAGQEF